MSCSAERPDVLQELGLEDGRTLPPGRRDVLLHGRVPGERQQGGRSLRENASHADTTRDRKSVV